MFGVSVIPFFAFNTTNKRVPSKQEVDPCSKLGRGLPGDRPSGPVKGLERRLRGLDEGGARVLLFD